MLLSAGPHLRGGGQATLVAGLKRRAQAVLFVSGRGPPMRLLQSSADHQLAPFNANSLDRAMPVKKQDITLKPYPWVGHSPLPFALSRPLHRDAPTLGDILAFIDSHLPPDPAAGSVIASANPAYQGPAEGESRVGTG